MGREYIIYDKYIKYRQNPRNIRNIERIKPNIPNFITEKQIIDTLIKYNNDLVDSIMELSSIANPNSNSSSNPSSNSNSDNSRDSGISEQQEVQEQQIVHYEPGEQIVGRAIRLTSHNELSPDNSLSGDNESSPGLVISRLINFHSFLESEVRALETIR